jgi:uncharacterized membrane protein YecN with MAPEG domain
MWKDMGTGVAVTSFYAALLALVYVWLSLRVIRTRRAERIGLGDGDNQRLRRAIRAHGNFVEYAVFALLLMAFAELQGAPGWAVHLLGLALLAGRLCHAMGFGREPESGRLRVFGMQLTFTAIGAAALANLGLALASWMPV